MKKYIIFDNNSKKVKDIFDKEPKFINKLASTMLAEYNSEIPQGDYLRVVNLREEIEIWTEKETAEQANEKGEIIYEEVEVEKSRTYLTCDLMPQFFSEEIKAKQFKLARISELKRLLMETDYKAIKYAEGLISEEEYAPIKAQRQAYRDEINELEML